MPGFRLQQSFFCSFEAELHAFFALTEHLKFQQALFLYESKTSFFQAKNLVTLTMQLLLYYVCINSANVNHGVKWGYWQFSSHRLAVVDSSHTIFKTTDDSSVLLCSISHHFYPLPETPEFRHLPCSSLFFFSCIFSKLTATR